MWNGEEAFDKVVQIVNRLNEFEWKHIHVFKGIQTYNKTLYDNITKIQNDIDSAFTAKDEAAFDISIKEYENLINKLYLIYTGKKAG